MLTLRHLITLPAAEQDSLVQALLVPCRVTGKRDGMWAEQVHAGHALGKPVCPLKQFMPKLKETRAKEEVKIQCGNKVKKSLISFIRQIHNAFVFKECKHTEDLVSFKANDVSYT